MFSPWEYITLGSLFLWFNQVHVNVPLPYMDEIFHIPQAQRYCNGDYTWDAKITTPPGIYLINTILNRIGLTSCNVLTLRATNLVGLILGSYLLVKLLKRRDLLPLLLSMPLFSFYANLYYTDVWASLLVLIGLALTLNAQHWSAALVFIVSLAFRQTNIVWAGYAGVLAMCEVTIDPKSAFEATIVSQLTTAFRNIRSPSIWVPYGLVAGSFGAFLYQNGGIAMGDKENHVVSHNLPQVFYFALFSAALSAPLALRSPWFGRYLTQLKKLIYPTRLIGYVLSLSVISWVIHRFTVVHPFILADNRHYTFYLWRRILHRPEHPALKFAMAPIYHASLDWILSAAPVVSFQSIIYWLAVCAVLIPSPLLEPRYYALPFAIWRIFIIQQKASKVEILYNLCIGAATAAIFAYTKTHFMW